MENHERVERELLEQCGQVATLMEYCVTETMRQVHRAAQRTLSCQASLKHKQSVMAKIARLADAKTQLKRFVHIDGKHASGRVHEWRQKISRLARDWRRENHVLIDVVVNANYIEPWRFLEDACNLMLERVRDAIEIYGSVKVNTAFNDEFATNDKHANKSINTKNIEIHRFAWMIRAVHH